MNANAESIRQQVRETFLKIFPNINQTQFDFQKERTEYENWDSLTHMQLVSELESACHISFSMEEVAGINKADDLVTLVQKKQHAK